MGARDFTEMLTIGVEEFLAAKLARLLDIGGKGR